LRLKAVVILSRADGEGPRNCNPRFFEQRTRPLHGRGPSFV
jgi:hypothetical protein